MKIFIRSPYNYDTEEASKASAITSFGVSKTQQHFADECDINAIVAQYQMGRAPIAPERIPLGDDFYNITDYQSAMNAVRKGHEAFHELPANVRSQFNNDAQAFVTYVTNPANIDSVRAMGLAPAAAAPAASPVSVSNSEPQT